MISSNSRVDFANSKIYSYSQNKPQQTAKTETEKETAQKAAYTDAVAFSSATQTEGKTVTMSEKAQNYLSDLKKKFGDEYNFVVADFSSDEEASELLASGGGSINVLITPETLEKMAADSDTAAYYEDIITKASGELSDMKEQLGENADNVKKYGFSVGSDGKVNYYALMKESFKTTDENGVETETDKVSASFLSDLISKVEEISARRDEAAEESAKMEKTLSIPPESFKKYLEDDGENTVTKKDDYGSLPPESFKKYQKEADKFASEEDYGNLPPESFKKYQQDLDVKA